MAHWIRLSLLCRCKWTRKSQVWYRSVSEQYPPPCLRHEKRVRSTPLVSRIFLDLRSGAVCSLVWSCQFFCFKDSAGPAPNSSHDPFSDNFALFFRSTFFTTICTKNAPAGASKTPQKLKKMKKTWPLNAPAAELCKKAPSGRGEALKAWQALCFRDI